MPLLHPAARDYNGRLRDTRNVAKHPGELTRSQMATASLPAAETVEEDGEHVHEPFLFGWKVNESGQQVEIWRCLADFQVSEQVPNPNLDEDHPDHSPELAGQGPETVAGRTIYPGDPDHPYGKPCGWIEERVHDPELFDNAQSSTMTQREFERSIAPKSAKVES